MLDLEVGGERFDSDCDKNECFYLDIRIESECVETCHVS